MSAIGIRDLSRRTSQVVDDVQASRRPAVVTRRGMPVVAIIPLDPDSLEDWVLGHAREYVESMEDAEAAAAAGETIPLEQLLAEADDEVGASS